MQLTSFDRWLREKFAYETHVQVLRLPETMPRGIKVVELPDVPGRRYQYLLVARRTKDANALFSILKENSMMYHTQIIQRTGLFVRLVAPEEKSVTWWLISWTMILIACAGAGMVLIRLWQNPEIQKNLRDALEILKG